MRILHVSDTHLGIRQTVLGAPRGWSRADDHLDALKMAVELAGPVDLIVHTGDLFDRSRPPRPAIEAAADLLTRLAARCPVVVMPGNHDRRGLRTTVPLDVPGLHVVNQAERLMVAGLALAVVPFLSDARGWAFAAAQAVGAGADLLLCHQAVDGCQVPGFTFRAGRRRDTLGPQHLPPGIQHVLCGHIHPRQALPLGAAQVVMPGSTARSSFSERDQVKGAAVWDLDRVQAGTLARGAYIVDHHQGGPGRARPRARTRTGKHRQLALF
ncbi:MAG: hypothetical protein GXP62_00235 [Oligoflexia bacterium]|nr:hypothetical protein [Oligoflexia bacterium]